MVKRIFAGLAVAALAALTPTLATANNYPSSVPTLTCDRQVVAVGESFNCTVAVDFGTDIQIQATTAGADVSIAGTVVSPVHPRVNDSATFALTAPGQVGDIDIVTIVDGTVYTDAAASARVQVVKALSGGASAGLSSTGFEGTGILIGAGALIVVGGAVLVAARRRDKRQTP